MPARPPIIAVGLLTQEDLNRLGNGFSRLYPVDDADIFDDLLRAIDEASEKKGLRSFGDDRPN